MNRRRWRAIGILVVLATTQAAGAGDTHHARPGHSPGAADGALPADGTRPLDGWFAYAFFGLGKSEAGWNLALYGALGYEWRWLQVKLYNEAQGRSYYWFSDHALVAAAVLRLGRHDLSVGPLFGVRVFTMGYGWARGLYGLDLGWTYRATDSFGCGLEWQWVRPAGGAAAEGRWRFAPVLRW